MAGTITTRSRLIPGAQSLTEFTAAGSKILTADDATNGACAIIGSNSAARLYGHVFLLSCLAGRLIHHHDKGPAIVDRGVDAPKAYAVVGTAAVEQQARTDPDDAANNAAANAERAPSSPRVTLNSENGERRLGYIKLHDLQDRVNPVRRILGDRDVLAILLIGNDPERIPTEDGSSIREPRRMRRGQNK
ncbi:hypothetical protein GGI24_002839 [Coemansia furcata]|nr:hypothetical protein GGI24_002839 [Coemansia furcata]